MVERIDSKLDVRVDAYTRVCLALITVLLTVLIVGLWANHAPQPPAATAAETFVDASAQRNAMLDQQKLTNRKLDELLDLFRSGSAKVQVTEEPSKKDDKIRGLKKAK